MKSRLLVFLVSFFLILTGVELAMRRSGESFQALTDPLLLKAAILERTPETKVLFLGTSRFVDGIEQERFSAALNEITGESIRVLNGATTGSQGDRSAYFVELATRHPGLTHVIMEASPPALMRGDLGFEGVLEEETIPKSDPDARKSVFADRFETSLQDWFRNHSALARYRKSLRPKSLLKLPVLLLSDHVDPNVWSRKGVLKSLLMPSSGDSEPELPAEIAPESITEGSQAEDLIKEKDQFAMMIRLCKAFDGSSLKVIWVAPPVKPEERAANHNANYTAMYTAAAERYGITFYDYSGQDLDEVYFRDPTHLNEAGRNLFSRILARDLKEHFTDQPKQD